MEILLSGEIKKSGFIDWGVAVEVMPGETECGDVYVVKEFPEGVLVGAVDGLGHGLDAAAAGRTVAATLSDFAQESVISLFRHAHEAAQKTRGVVMSLASFSKKDGTMTWAGVGNVEGVLLRADPNASPATDYLLLRSGGVGFNLPELRATVIPVMPGDTLIFATDGVRSNFSQALLQSLYETPQKIAERILAHNKKNTDDALVLVVRYGGQAHERVGK